MQKALLCRVMNNILNKLHQEALIIIFFLVVFACIALKLKKRWPNFSSLNPRLSLSSVATEDREQFLCQNIFFKNKTGPLFLDLK